MYDAGMLTAWCGVRWLAGYNSAHLSVGRTMLTTMLGGSVVRFWASMGLADQWQLPQLKLGIVE